MGYLQKGQTETLKGGCGGERGVFSTKRLKKIIERKKGRKNGVNISSNDDTSRHLKFCRRFDFQGVVRVKQWVGGGLEGVADVTKGNLFP